MAIQETRTLPAPFIEDIGKDFAKSLVGVTGLPCLLYTSDAADEP